MIGKIKNVLSRKKTYPLPANRGLVKWTDDALKYNLPIKKVEIFKDGYVYTIPYMNEAMVGILEETWGIPIVDLTGKRSLPRLDLVKVVKPEILEVGRF